MIALDIFNSWMSFYAEGMTFRSFIYKFISFPIEYTSEMASKTILAYV